MTSSIDIHQIERRISEEVNANSHIMVDQKQLTPIPRGSEKQFRRKQIGLIEACIVFFGRIKSATFDLIHISGHISDLTGRIDAIQNYIDGSDRRISMLEQQVAVLEEKLLEAERKNCKDSTEG